MDVGASYLPRWGKSHDGAAEYRKSVEYHVYSVVQTYIARRHECIEQVCDCELLWPIGNETVQHRSSAAPN